MTQKSSALCMDSGPLGHHGDIVLPRVRLGFDSVRDYAITLLRNMVVSNATVVQYKKKNAIQRSLVPSMVAGHPGQSWRDAQLRVVSEL